ncbi:unnamed protein product [Clavelina lepadiformis]|uniref:Uncharacterized protein n=1 Tax=Clavelina lepadiformis TaxID=159417 RepID=A0ABP0H2Z1_CLALP
MFLTSFRLTLFITTYIITLFTSTKLCSTAGKRLFSGDDKVSDDARSTKLLKKYAVRAGGSGNLPQANWPML